MEPKSRKKKTVTVDMGTPRESAPSNADPPTETDRTIAQVLLSPDYASVRVMLAADDSSSGAKRINPGLLAELLRDQAAAVQRNDMTQVEAMLINQAAAMQSLFTRLSEMALSAEFLPHFDTFMKLALRAQSQCRATLETLGAIKNPPVVIARQANVTSGPQQVNNNITAPPHARENKIEQSKLSGERHELCQDTRAPSFESRADPPLETVGEVNRAKVRRGKG